MNSHLRTGVIAAVAALVLDQASKLWLLFVFDIARRGAVRSLRSSTWCWPGTSGSASAGSRAKAPYVQIILMAHQGGGGGGSGDLDGAVANPAGDSRPRPHHWRRHRQRHRPLRLRRSGRFILFDLQIGEKTFNWYVFNLADVAIVAGVAALLYDSFLGVPAAKAP